MMALIGLAIYLGIGAMLHAVFVGSHFDWSSAWTFGWLLGWPIMMMGALLAFALLGSVVVIPIMLVSEWNEKRQIRARIAARRARQ
jgi:hypothetical protein